MLNTLIWNCSQFIDPIPWSPSRFWPMGWILLRAHCHWQTRHGLAHQWTSCSTSFPVLMTEVTSRWWRIFSKVKIGSHIPSSVTYRTSAMCQVLQVVSVNQSELANYMKPLPHLRPVFNSTPFDGVWSNTSQLVNSHQPPTPSKGLWNRKPPALERALYSSVKEVLNYSILAVFS